MANVPESTIKEEANARFRASEGVSPPALHVSPHQGRGCQTEAGKWV